MLISIIASLASLVVAPFIAGKLMGLKGGLGKGALIGLTSLGVMQISGLVASFLGPLGGILAILMFIAAWFQIVKIIHGTDVANTIVFMFWQLFFELLFASLLALIISPDAVTWWWRG